MEAILIGLLTNALYDLLKVSVHHRIRLNEELGHATDSVDRATLEHLHQSVAEDAAPQLSNSGLTELLLLIRGTAFNAFSQRMLASIAVDQMSHRTQDLKAQLDALIRIEAPTAWNEYTTLTQWLWDSVVDAARITIEEARNSADLSHRMDTAARNSLLLDHVEAIRNTLEIYAAYKRPSYESLLSFEDAYRNQVQHRHRSITPPQFDGARRVPLDDIYVTPTLTSADLVGDGERVAASLTVDHIVRNSTASVVLGDPGGGKSTLAQKICLALSSHDTPTGTRTSLLTPLLVIVRTFAQEKQRTSCSILDYLERVVASQYQMRPPEGALEFMLANGRAFVIFDGLDELLDTALRREITLDIESFLNLYPAVRSLVTSRRVGYSQSPLDPVKFQTFFLAPFSDDQVVEYVAKWFSSDPLIAKSERRRYIDGFVEESADVPDLRENPLLLALMCTIYRGEGYLPRNRPAVYEKCAVMLFERWDRSRHIRPSMRIESSLATTMKYVAHWMYTTPGTESGVTERQLISRAAQYFRRWRFETDDEANGAAADFVEFCRGRAWVFTDVGSSGDGERLYSFTHRTFIEYFTAAHLTRIHPTSESLVVALEPHIATAEWDVVAQLAVQIQDKNVEGAGDSILSQIVNMDDHVGSPERAYKSAFISRCLSFMVPHPSLCRSIARRVLGDFLALAQILASEYGIGEPTSRLDSTSGGEFIDDLRREAIVDAYGSVLACAPENRPAVSAALYEEVDLIDTDLASSARKASVLLDPVGFLVLHTGTLNKEVREYWQSQAVQFAHDRDEELFALAESYPIVAAALLRRSPERTVELFSHASVDVVFGSHIVFPLNLTYVDFGEFVISSVLASRRASVGADKPIVRCAEGIRHYFLDNQPPWFSRDITKYMEHSLLGEPLHEESTPSETSQVSEVAFHVTDTARTGAMLMLLSWIELRTRGSDTAELKTSLTALPREVVDIAEGLWLLRNNEGVLSDNGRLTLRQFGIDNAGVELCARWSEHGVDFTQ